MEQYFDSVLNDYVCTAGATPWVVREAVPKKDYSLFLTFANGENRVYDARPLLSKAIYAPLRDIRFFLTASVSGGTVVWNDDIDIAPEHLFECSQPI